VVQTRFGRVTPGTATRLQSDVADLHSLQDETGAHLFPFLSSDSERVRRVKAEVRLRVRVCVSYGLISVGKSAFGQYLSGDESLFDLSTDFANACLTKMFPGIAGQVAGALAQRGLNDAWPAVQQAWEHSPQAQVLRNWLAGLSY
jgi:hypothetical protein